MPRSHGPVRLTIDLDKDVHRDLRIRAFQSGDRHVSVVLRRLIAAYLSGPEQQDEVVRAAYRRGVADEQERVLRLLASPALPSRPGIPAQPPAS